SLIGVGAQNETIREHDRPTLQGRANLLEQQLPSRRREQEQIDYAVAPSVTDENVPYPLAQLRAAGLADAEDLASCLRTELFGEPLESRRLSDPIRTFDRDEVAWRVVPPHVDSEETAGATWCRFVGVDILLIQGAPHRPSRYPSTIILPDHVRLGVFLPPLIRGSSPTKLLIASRYNARSSGDVVASAIRSRCRNARRLPSPSARKPYWATRAICQSSTVPARTHAKRTARRARSRDSSD